MHKSLWAQGYDATEHLSAEQCEVASINRAQLLRATSFGADTEHDKQFMVVVWSG